MKLTLALSLVVFLLTAPNIHVDTQTVRGSKEVQTFVYAHESPYMLVLSTKDGWAITREDVPIYHKGRITLP